jgi:hypothetical protein
VQEIQKVERFDGVQRKISGTYISGMPALSTLVCSLLTTTSTTQHNGEWHPETFARFKDIFLLPYQESPLPLLPRQRLSAAGVYFSSHPARRSRCRCYCYSAWLNKGHRQIEGIRRANRGKGGRKEERHHCRRSMLDIRAATVRFLPPSRDLFLMNSERRLAQDLTHPLITTLQQECTRASCPEMKAGEWLYLCVAHGNDGAMEVCWPRPTRFI